MATAEKDNVTTVIVTTDRPDDLFITLQKVAGQSRKIEKIVVVDTGNNPKTREVIAGFPLAEHFHSLINLGGAGGFAFGVMLAISKGADWIWLMDDDGYPETVSCLEQLIDTADNRRLDVVAPLVIDPEDPERLSFPHRFNGRYQYARAHVEETEVIENFTHLFNGALFRKAVFFRAGLPDMRLFIRGDEVEFMHRMRQAKIRLGTATRIGFMHPSGWPETVPLVAGYFHAVVPNSDIKKYCFFRNRGYIFRRYGLFRLFMYDMFRYPYYFIVKNRGDWKGLKLFYSAMWDGLRSRFKYPIL